MRYRIITLMCALALVLGVIGGCSNPPTDDGAGKGSLSLSIQAPGPKGILSDITLESVEAILTKSGEATVTLAGPVSGGTAQLSAPSIASGVWAVSVKAYYMDAGQRYVAYAASDSASVVPNTANVKTITLAAQVGGLEVVVAIPQGLGVTSGTVTVIDPSDVGQAPTQTLASPGSSATASFTGLRPTTMTIRVTLKNAQGGVVASDENTVDVWPGQTKRYGVSFADGSLVVHLITASQPAAPVGLAYSSVAGGLRLSWQANAEADMAGYAVYRAEGNSGAKRLLTDALVVGTQYTDASALPANVYTYWVQAYNTDGLSSPYSLPLVVDGTSPSGKTYCIIAAVGDYPGTSLDLAGPPLDAAKMNTTLKAGNASLQGPVVVLNSQATKAGIKAAIDTFKAAAAPADSLIFYYSGHGTNGLGPSSTDEGICPHDIVDASGNFQMQNCITDKEFQSWFAASPTQSILFIFDSCFSGGMVKLRVAGVETSIPFGLPVGMAKDLNQAGYTVMMASDKSEYSYDSGAGGVYTLKFLEGLTTHQADANGDGGIYPQELHAWLLPRVQSATGGAQNPTFYKGSAVQDICLYRY